MRVSPHNILFWALLCPLLIGIAAHPAWPRDHAIDAFIGEYSGQTVSSEDVLDKRDLGVTIESKDDGFAVTWTTITQNAAGKTKKKTYSIDFQPTDRKNIYASAMKANVFGGRTPLDPLKGDPYVWARITDHTLTVHAMIVTDEGGYEMQVYDRTLTDSGMKLKFSRIRDGERLKLIEGTLKRTN